jgi:hypothetical protein
MTPLIQKANTLFLAILLSQACATQKSKRIQDPKAETDLAQNQERDKELIVDQELQEKFRVKEIILETQTKTQTKTQTQRSKKAPVLISQVNPAETTKRAQRKIQQGTEVLSEPIYPLDYPQELKSWDDSAKKSWDQFKFNIPLKELLHLDVSYLGMTVGRIVLKYSGKKSLDAKEVHHFQAFFRSSSFYSNIYEINDQLDTFVDVETFRTLKFNLEQRESKQDVSEVQLFNPENLWVKGFQKITKEDVEKNKQTQGWLTQYYIDPMSILWFMRGLPLAEKQVFEIPVPSKGKMIQFRMKVLKAENLKTNVGSILAYPIEAKADYVGKNLKSGDMTFWLEKNPPHRLLKIQAKIKIGLVSAEIVKPQEN